MSEDFEKQKKLLVLVHGSGVVRAGQWARRFVRCLQHIIDNQTNELGRPYASKFCMRFLL